MPALRVLTLLGTRPEIIRLSRVIPLLDRLLGLDSHLLVHTGQNSDRALSANFFAELGLREPDQNLGATGTLGEQLAAIFPGVEQALTSFQPDRLLVLGDTNSALGAIVAARAHPPVPVYHMEAGNRSYSPYSPEEVNRRLVDHSSAVLLPYTERARQNLLREGIHSSRILVTGNPIWEVIEHYRAEWMQSDVLTRLGIESGKFFLVTLHRAENVDHWARLGNFLRAFDNLQCQYSFPVIVSAHPRLLDRVGVLDRTSPPTLLANRAVRFLPPFPFFDFLLLQSSAFCTLTDSGTVQEESCLLRRPCVVLRDHTERPETVEVGATVLSSADPASILRLVEQVTRSGDDSDPAKTGHGRWTPPADYLRLNVADTVARIVLSHREGSLL